MARSSRPQHRPRTETLEEGDIFFFYRPKVDIVHPQGLGDVQRSYVVLHCRRPAHYRLLILGRKRLPDVRRHEREWGFVETVSSSRRDIRAELGPRDYRTKTRGRRHEPEARPAGEGVYALVLKDGRLHLVYTLELPRRLLDVQKELGIRPEASFALSIKNPDAPSPPGLGLRPSERPRLPKRLQGEFGDRRFLYEDPRPLDYPGVEFVMVGARPDPTRAYRVPLPSEDADDDRADIAREFGYRPRTTPPLSGRGWA